MQKVNFFLIKINYNWIVTKLIIAYDPIDLFLILFSQN